MKLSCPRCGGMTHLDLMVMDGCARQVVALAAQMPAEISKRLMLYLSLHVSGSRGLPWDRAEKLMAELVEGIQAARVTRNRHTWSAPLSYWSQALDEVLDHRERLTLPLKGNGYLLSIVGAIAEKSASREERGGIDRARGATPVGAHASHQPAKKHQGPKKTMPQGVRDQLHDQLKGKRDDVTP